MIEKSLMGMGCAAALLVATGCIVRTGPAPVVYSQPAEIVVQSEPPPVRVEVAPPAPVVGYAWVPGYWSWGGRSWIWVSGRWDRPPRPYARWEPGRWERHPRGWRWHEGHWR